MNRSGDEMQHRLAERFRNRLVGNPVNILDVTDSTNDVVKEAGIAGVEEGFTVIAFEQRRGRGRRGRCWVSNPGQGVYLSTLLRPDMPPSEACWFAMLGGVAALEAVRELGLTGLSLKWPNDVLVRGRKIAGVLVEPRTGEAKIEFLVLGIGVNVRQSEQSWTEALNTTATSCLMEGVSVSLEEVASALMDRIDSWYARLKSGERNRLQEAWTAHGGTSRMPVIE
jgi:BirA family biotin operon repressor/biotin-[acetyl-CoA-carboxylase] ligase